MEWRRNGDDVVTKGLRPGAVWDKRSFPGLGQSCQRTLELTAVSEGNFVKVWSAMLMLRLRRSAYAAAVDSRVY